MSVINAVFLYPPEDKIKKHLQEKLGDLAELKFIYPPDENETTLLPLVPKADIIIGWRASEELIKKAKRFSLYIFPGTGLHNLVEIFRKLKRQPKPLLINTHGNSYAVAQHTVALLLALTNRVIPHHERMVEGKWNFGVDEIPSTPMRDRHVGFLGYGAINSKVHKFLAGFDVKFSALKRDWSDFNGKPPTSLNKYDGSQLTEFLEAVDTLIVALPVTSQTDGLIGDRELKILGKNGILVNVGRGRIVEEDHLYWALKTGYIAGAALDVWYNYAPEYDRVRRLYPFSFPFHKLKNVVLSPHRASSPFSDERLWDDIIENIRCFAEGKRGFTNVVDLEKGY